MSMEFGINLNKLLQSKPANTTIKISKQYCDIKRSVIFFLIIMTIILFIVSLSFFIYSFFKKPSSSSDPIKKFDDENQISLMKILGGFFSGCSFICIFVLYFNYLLLKTDLGCAANVISNSVSFTKQMWKNI